MIDQLLMFRQIFVLNNVIGVETRSVVILMSRLIGSDLEQRRMSVSSSQYKTSVKPFYNLIYGICIIENMCSQCCILCTNLPFARQSVYIGEIQNGRSRLLYVAHPDVCQHSMHDFGTYQLTRIKKKHIFLPFLTDLGM